MLHIFTYIWGCKHFQSFYAGFRLFGRGGGMKYDLKKIMFSGVGDTLIPLSFDSVKFCAVMSVFHNYECQVRH